MLHEEHSPQQTQSAEAQQQRAPLLSPGHTAVAAPKRARWRGMFPGLSEMRGKCTRRRWGPSIAGQCAWPACTARSAKESPSALHEWIPCWACCCGSSAFSRQPASCADRLLIKLHLGRTLAHRPWPSGMQAPMAALGRGNAGVLRPGHVSLTPLRRPALAHRAASAPLRLPVRAQAGGFFGKGKSDKEVGAAAGGHIRERGVLCSAPRRACGQAADAQLAQQRWSCRACCRGGLRPAAHRTPLARLWRMR